ncbi:hypothetical protein LUZ63_000342 [Rhynchospora breviuscula]|uniref:PHD-type zinc finger plants domain-containing protein n=1 Tax=Rhynchospora breviuscula TaxID=2022672 RepID=A0A9Q0CV61_9POAL|nr:hypothetical protein LUZ63_000342 [Rhynchospora breviuscula]
MGKGCASSSSPSQPSIVCCMCGDPGLPQELFRCKICIFRSQHKYCSDLYLKTNIYRACNWCLREEGGKTVSPDTSADREIPTNNSEKNNGDHSSFSLIARTCLLRLNKPIKKKLDVAHKPLRILIRRPVGSENMSPGSAMKGKQRYRAKVRRYKLLEEVSR